jgi:hypothetical protein
VVLEQGRISRVIESYAVEPIAADFDLALFFSGLAVAQNDATYFLWQCDESSRCLRDFGTGHVSMPRLTKIIDQTYLEEAEGAAMMTLVSSTELIVECTDLVSR